jgi:NAD(P)-dependent dehydrogenase (short-subunit alcohol dehydrogenase family)
MARWTSEDIPDLGGRTAIVTGANTGIGLETAAHLAGVGATVVLACRNLAKAASAVATIAERHPSSPVEVLELDLAVQGQIVDAAAEATERFPRIDILVNNAGVLGIPRTLTVDGFESVFGVNHLGHFAFTGRVLPTILGTPDSRVVTVSSLSHRFGTIRWNDLTGERRYSQSGAYAQSKLANLLFALELQRRLTRARASTSSLAVHPGFAATDIAAGPLERVPRLAALGARFVPTPSEAARPSLRAATDVGAYGGQFYGPGGPGGVGGPPVVTRPGRRALAEDDQIRLWEVSQALTGVEFPV